MQTANEDLQILRALCQTKDAELRRRACEILRNYEWVDGEHRVIFEVCAALDSFGARINVTTVAAQVTRAGFPDVDFDALFEPLPMADTELAKRLNALERNAR